ncbi:hypothetical protein ABII15_17525 [Streptomyces sp. HUAS MG91]|uniref:Integral membrane protein n=1 Tax=Streptomyces tabacisoli TaxID=3156398 RepID=A0AAU8ISY1_9ACTN
MPAPENRISRPLPRNENPNRWIHVAGLGAGIIFGFGFWAGLIASFFTGETTFAAVTVPVVITAAACAGFVGWRRQRDAWSWAALLLALAGTTLSQALTS